MIPSIDSRIYWDTLFVVVSQALKVLIGTVLAVISCTVSAEDSGLSIFELGKSRRSIELFVT